MSNSPYEIPVKTGQSVYLCQCGKSANPPYCDGAHSSVPGAQPLVHTVANDGVLYVCGCGKTRNMPWCDGSHTQ